ncbi:MAG: type VI secretion system tip protein TssI/VgrG [Pirellulaceae bacterium]
MKASQASRQLTIATPLGQDFFLLKSVAGRDRLSSLFQYELEVLCEDPAVDPADVIGQNVTFSVSGLDGELQQYNGYVNNFWYEGTSDRATSYRATVVPWFWFLTQTSDCRIFQDQTTPEIIEAVFADFGFSEYEMAHVRGDYAKREYCVQYRESDFAFLSRMMEEEGIFYFHRHENGKHVLVLSDGTTAYRDATQSEIVFPEPGHAENLLYKVSTWRHKYRFLPGKVAHTDYNFKSPNNNLISADQTRIAIPLMKNLEQYDFPGRFELNSQGRSFARIRMQEIEVDHDQVVGDSNYISFCPAAKFRVGRHRIPSERGREYALAEVELYASEGGTYITGTEDESPKYENRFIAMPAEVVYRPARSTPKAIVEGPQTAVVVGPPGEEIFPDEHGRVKVQFHWDRRGKLDEDSSCWIRVSQAHAGNGWGGIDLPRIGEEVIVDFLEGDPDRPIITGRVYNGKNRPPFDLPAGMTRSGMKSNTHKGSGYNEISMDDTAGAEQIRTNAQFNMDTTVGNNQTLIVNVDRTEDIGNNDSLTVGNDKSENVGNNKDVNVGNNMNVDVGNKLVVNAGSSITLKCGASRIHMNSGGVITISGTIITTAAAANAAVAAPLTQIIGGAMLTTVGGINMMNGGVCKVAAAGLTSVSGGKVDVVASGITAIKGGTIELN